MSGFNPDKSDLHRLGRTLSGDVSVDEKQQLQADLSDDSSHLNRFLRGLRDFPTSLLGVALDSHFATSQTTQRSYHQKVDVLEIRSVLEELISSYLEGAKAAFIPDNRTIIDQAYEKLVSSDAGRAERASFFETAGRVLETAYVELSQRRMEGDLDLDESSPTLNETVSASGQTTIALSLHRPGEVLGRQQRLARLESHDPALAQIYFLYAFAGRTHHEIAELLNMDESNVVDSEEVATVEVCMEDT